MGFFVFLIEMEDKYVRLPAAQIIGDPVLYEMVFVWARTPSCGKIYSLAETKDSMQSFIIVFIILK